MKMKRIVSLCLSFLLLTSVAVAAETPAATEPSYEITPVTDQTMIPGYGVQL